MKTNDVKRLMVNALSILYDTNEIDAITRVYIQDRLPSFGINQIAEHLIELSPAAEVQIRDDIRKLSEGCPLQYITGSQWFYGRPFLVSGDVLIPRPETEELVTIVLDEFKNKAPWLIDLGTGSGCIAVTLKLELPGSEVYATDISARALKVALENATKHGAAVHFIEDDMLSTALPDKEMFDLIVSNPPYISFSESCNLMPNVRAFEPACALFAPDSDPCIFYRAIANFATRKLNRGGILFVEIHQARAKNVCEIFYNAGLMNPEIKHDISGNERFIRVSR